jgi:hypothetical protein
VNERQRKIINLLLDGFKGKLSTSKYAKLMQSSEDMRRKQILIGAMVTRIGVQYPDYRSASKAPRKSEAHRDNRNENG